MLDPAHFLLLKRQAPLVKVLDVQSSTSDLTTYTFTGCNLGDLGSVASVADTYGTHPHIRSMSRKGIVVIVHGEDAATTFNVSSVTIGGVGGTEQGDRGGGTNAINTAIYTWTTDSLQGITGTDIAVTWSEAVTSCAIGVLLVENIGLFQSHGTGTAQGTGVLTTGLINPASDLRDMFPVFIAGTTLATGGGTEALDFYYPAGRHEYFSPTLLYIGNTAEMDYAAVWTYAPGYHTQLWQVSFSWSGTGAGDAAAILLY